MPEGALLGKVLNRYLYRRLQDVSKNGLSGAICPSRASKKAGREPHQPLSDPNIDKLQVFFHEHGTSAL